MSVKKIIYLLLVYITLVLGQMDKSSLTFVIDDTSSMQGEIDQVKDGVNFIFESVIKSKDSPIDDFIIVTFNDKPHQVQFLTQTKDQNIFRGYLSKIKAHGGSNCPESSLSGIKLGLEKSRPGSFMYVFTDDVADDVWLLDEVQNLAISKNIQVVFILTRYEICGDDDRPEFEYYVKLAHATSGEVFRMDKTDVEKILHYISDKIKTRHTEIVSKTLPAGYGHNVKIPIDPAMPNVTITCTGTNPEIKDVTAPDGSKPSLNTIIAIPDVRSVQIPNPMTGNYTAKVGSAWETKFVATATNEVNFNYGFSPVTPTSMADTVTMPIKDVKSHICVQIFSKEPFLPSKIILYDDDDKVIGNLPLKTINNEKNIYITERILPPGGLFKIGVFGYHENSKSNITRKSKTFIEVQRSSETIEDMSPTMVIDKGLKIKVKYDDTINLTCNVEAYPKPDISWKDDDGNIYSTEVLTFKLPYSYKAEMATGKVTKNKTFTCSATNSNGHNISRNIKVETERTQYLDILEQPKDTNVIYRNSETIYCKVDALPPAMITWYGNGAVLRTDEFFEISDGGDVLTIKQMIPHLIGDYSCAATNGLESKDLGFTLSIVGTAPSTSITGPININAEYNHPLFVSCQVKGYPEPKILWINEETGEEIKSAPVAVPTPYDFGKEMQIEKVDKNATYKCIAKNDNGEHSSTVTVVTVQKVHFNIIEAPKDTIIKYQEDGQIFCKIDAYPAVSIQWKYKGKAIKNNAHYEISEDRSTLKVIAMQPDLEGIYTCRVKNKDNLKNLKWKLRTSGTEKPQIDKSQNEIKVLEGSPIDIDCRIIKGTPPPTISWEFQSDNDVKFGKKETSTKSIHFESVTRYDSGVYRCTASNVRDHDYHIVDLTVEFPPTIEESKKQIDSMEGEKTMLQCLVRGYPVPTVVWSLNGANITASEEYKIYPDNSLWFSASLTNNGKFTCTATNEHGTARIETQVDYYKEIQFKTPEDTSITMNVGDKTSLRCEAVGYPAPTITWDFLSSEAKPTDKSRVLETAKSPDELVLKIVNTDQDGLYICTASNKRSEKTLSFKVEVKEPAHIIMNTALSKPIRAVKGDLVRIPCQAVGKPRPSVTWMNGGQNIATDVGSYSLDPEGALLIEGITEGGSFLCIAKNDPKVSAYMPFIVEIEDFPRPTQIYATYQLKVGQPAEVKCPIPHTLVDLLRWYKGSALQASGELKFDSVLHSNAGVYTCRVTNRITVKSESRSVEITVIA